MPTRHTLTVLVSVLNRYNCEVERSLRSRVKTVLDVDQTLQRVDSVAADMGPLLESFATALNDFNATLERFGQSLDRFSSAAETIDATAAKMEPLMNDLTKTLQSLQVVTSPLAMAREGVRRVRPKDCVIGTAAAPCRRRATSR